MSRPTVAPGRGAFRTAAPPGFVVLACLMGCLALVAATLDDRMFGVHSLLARAVFATVGVLSALAAEALWHGRSWLRRVMKLWAAATPLSAAILAVSWTIQEGPGTMVPAGVFVLLATALPCMGAAMYVAGADPGTLPLPRGARLHP
jgi:hypothetical protein